MTVIYRFFELGDIEDLSLRDECEKAIATKLLPAIFEHASGKYRISGMELEKYLDGRDANLKFSY